MQPCARPTDLFVVSCLDPTLTSVTLLGTTKKSLNGHQTPFLVRGWGLAMRLRVGRLFAEAFILVVE